MWVGDLVNVLVWGLDVCLLEGWSLFAGGYGGLGGGSALDLFVGWPGLALW